MEATVADTIRELTREHLETRSGLLFGQCITAVGWIQNTIPPYCQGLVELPMNDVSGPGIAIGAALLGRRPILVLRFQSFLWLASHPIVNYAAKANELFGYSAPLFIRAIATEGNSSGPAHTNCYHSVYMHMPGIAVAAPMTPNECKDVWKYYLEHGDPLLQSEHRRSYSISHEMEDIVRDDAELTIYAISASRLNAIEAVKALQASGIKVNLVHLYWLKPFLLDSRITLPLATSGAGLVIDSTFETASASQSIAYQLMLETGRPVKALGMFERCPGVAKHLENGSPDVPRIVHTVKEMIQRKKEWT